MKKEHYYLASRIPSKGGLKIIRTDEDFPKSYEEYIEGKCLEIFVPEYDRNAVLIHPLGNGDIVTALARKVESSRWESRVHENIHGYVMDIEDFSKQILPRMTNKGFDNCFYNWKIEEVEELEDSQLCFQTVKTQSEKKREFLDCINGEERVGFFYSVYRIITKREKVHLIVPKELTRIIQAACYEILPYYCRNQLFTISAGECVQSDADIILAYAMQLQYQKPARYRRIGLKDFIQRGIECRREDLLYFSQILYEESTKRSEIYAYIACVIEKILEKAGLDTLMESLEIYDLLADIIINTEGGELCDERLVQRVEKLESSEAQSTILNCFPCLRKNYREDKKNQNIDRETARKIDISLEYIKSPYPAGTVLGDVRKYYYSRERKKEWNVFQSELRSELERIALLPKKKEKYITLLFLAYENYRGKCTRFDQGVIPAPYDLEGMLFFLRKKTKSEREYKRYMEEVIKCYNKIFEIFISEKKKKAILKRVKKRVAIYLTDVWDENV